MNPPVKAAIAVHGRYHAFELAGELHRHGALVQVATTYPAFAARRFLPPGVALATAPWLEAWRRLHGRLPFVPAPEPGLSEAFGRFAARTLPDGANLLVGWSSATLEAIPPARDRGMAVVLERGSTHIAHQTDVLRDAARRLNAPTPRTPDRLIEREQEEYAQADAIAVPSRLAAQTFVARGVPENKLLVLPYGTTVPAELPDRPPPQGPLRVLFVGAVGIRKGVPWLLQAAEALRGKVALDLAGPVEAGMDSILAETSTRTVRFLGPRNRIELDGLYAAADVVCLPSLEEGFGLVLLEAMARGTPIVASDVSGGSELVEDGDTGMLVPPADTEALTSALQILADDRDRTRALGVAAREKIRARFTWAAYGERALDAYGRVLANRAATS